MKKLEPKVGDIVAMNKLPDAVWFDVLAVDGFALTVREHGTEYSKCYVDISLVQQIKKNIAE